METVKVLGEAVAVQHQGIIDRTETPQNSLGNLLIVGKFKRGRTDQPMRIHAGNIRAQLGYDPTNPDYIAVQDVLATGVPSLNVLRVAPVVQSGG